MINHQFLLQLVSLSLAFIISAQPLIAKDNNVEQAEDFEQLITKQLTQKQWQQDTDKLFTKINKLHPKPWRSISEKQFKSELSRIVGTSAHDSRHKTVTKLMQAVALLSKAGQDGQSKISPFQKAINFHLLPIRVSAFINGVYIVDASDKYKRLIGNRITNISGETIENVLSKVKPFINNENVHWQTKQAPLYALMPELLEVLNISTGQSVALEMINPKGMVDKSILKAVSFNQYNELFQEAIPFNILPLNTDISINLENKNYFHKQLEEATLYTQINRIADEQSFIDFIDDVSIEVKKNQDTSLIIDLRNNSGATVTNYSALTKMLDDFNGNFTGNRQELDIYVLTGHDTFSSAVFLAIDLKNKHNAILIGEETGGSPDQYLEADEFLLPHSKLLVNIATRFWKKSASNTMVLTLAPNYLVTPTSVDYFSQKDPVLYKALQIIELNTFE